MESQILTLAVRLDILPQFLVVENHSKNQIKLSSLVDICARLTLAVCFVFDDLFTNRGRRENLKMTNYTHIYSSFQSTQYSRVIATYAVLVFELVFWIVNRIKLTRKSDKLKTFFFDWFFYDNEKYLQHKNRENIVSSQNTNMSANSTTTIESS